MSDTSFAAILGGQEASAQQTFVFTPDWGQGRAIYGGVVGAALYKTMRGQIPTERHLRAMTVAFVGPVAPDETATVSASILRQGKSVTQAEARMTQHGQVVATANASFGAPRDSAIRVAAAPRPDAAAPADALALPYVPSVTPVFLQHFDLRWTRGMPPITGAEKPDFAGWYRHHEPVGDDETALIGLIDVWPPSVVPMLKRPAPLSSITWSIDLIDPGVPAAGDDWWYYDVHTQGAANGFVQADARLWRPDGQLAAVSRQTAAVFDQR